MHYRRTIACWIRPDVRWLIFLWTIATGALGCSGELTDEPTWELGQKNFAIENGVLETGYFNVGQLSSGCTATLIGPRTVLTAAHCVTYDKFPPYNTQSYLTFQIEYPFGTQHFEASRIVIHPQYVPPGYAVGDEEHHDVAVIQLAEEVAGVTPAALATTVPEEGDSITLLGYGFTDNYSNDIGTKYRAANYVDAIYEGEYSFEGASGDVGNICSGDSGGPDFATQGGYEVLIGVHSYSMGTADDYCDQNGYSMRVDSHLSWIQSEALGDLPSTLGWDTTPPYLKILAPKDGVSTQGDLSVWGDTWDESGISSVELWVDGNYVDETSSIFFDFLLQGLSDGEHTIQIKVMDGEGNSATDTVLVEKTSVLHPAVYISSPQDGDRLDPSFDLYVDLQDIPHVNTVVLLLDDQAVGTQLSIPYVFVMDDLAAGPHVLQIEVDDRDGNLYYSDHEYGKIILPGHSLFAQNTMLKLPGLK